MTIATRPPLRRFLAIERSVRDGEYPNAESLARELEVDPRTIQRDFAFMRDQLGAPLEYCRKRNGYFLADPSWAMPAYQLTEGELVSVFLAERLIRQYRGTPFEADLSRAFERNVRMLPEEVTVNLAALSDTLSVTPCVLTTQDVETFRTLSAAVRNLDQLRLRYWSALQNQETERVVDPLHLSLVDHDWYLIGWCHTRNEIRMFSTVRIRGCEPTGEHFERPEGFEITEYLGDSFRAVRGDGQSWNVVLRFTGAMAGCISEKIWHHTQTLDPQPDGSLLLRFHVSSLIEIRRWVLFWGADCEVLEPKELVDEIAAEVKQMITVYGSPDERVDSSVLNENP
ncbi:MAG: WYL domain-containing protein [Planctomycetaceae bacterium]|nr:WYL domain-containing protein [Planctomycetaceae bacterium]